ncbi:lipid IV(A) 3-deoxy-D-manno-octulosonic acid transferase [Vogesella indigofera]|uniref:lipid IV(A) 3-deoxy-D-manno-octulosonic acid transferase n=1 Tax=Vogesella indigofera TaxID=45465 RepID=UPI00234D1473|nr:lipid IV(A) 3-deoxy-D-manno-octulosonic acid transferase [Vogesella indigofera]MDC7702745.1 lipid IV(A) 3-deoxy-D-manno-octulosonic acid transferase [Vogesella indigofera]
MIARTLYSLLWPLATPLIKRYLRKRARQAPAYLEHWDERFGDALPQAGGEVIWLHAVSVGETRAAQPLVALLREQYPQARFVITQMTPTGRATAQQLYPDAEVRYLPYDNARVMRRFVAALRPRCLILMETEIWPNLLHACAQAGVPAFLVNARLSEKSLRGYRRIGALIRPALRQLRAVAAQSEADARRLALLGARNIQVCGNTKYDITPPPAQLELGRQFRLRTGERPVLVCASTREGEEALILDAWRKAEVGRSLLVLIPRHPERFIAVAQSAIEKGFAVQCRSDNLPVLPETAVWVGDSMGELFAYYVAADVAFVGGSLLDFGSQNLIEPASVGRPVLLGPSTYNFAEAAELALAAKAALQVQNADELVATAVTLLSDADQCEQLAVAARLFTQIHQGASQRCLALLS